MKQVVQNTRSGKLSVREVPEPKVAPGHLLVRTSASLISAGTERMAVSFARKNLAAKAKERPDLVRKVVDKARRDGVAATMRAVAARLDAPLPLGYSASGMVSAVGAGLEGRFRVGQRVAIAGAGLANHAEVNVVPGNLAAPVPDDVNDEEACFGTLAAIALHGVRNLGLEIGDTAAVIGVGLVGQLAVQLLDLAGVRVMALDYDAGRLDLARFGRAEIAWNLGDGDPAPTILAATDGLGCDGVLIAAATESSEPFETAAAIARDRARVALVGLTGTEIPYRAFMEKELSVVVSRSYGPGRYDRDYEGRDMKYPPGFVRWTESRNLAEAVRRMSRRRDHRLAVEHLITHRFAIEEAENAYAMIVDNAEPHLGVVLRYPGEAKAKSPRLRIPAHVSPGAAKKDTGCVLGMIGGGGFARSILIPEFAKLSGCRLHTIATRRGASAQNSQERFGFANAAADEDAVLGEPEINAVVIATPHASHAALTARALAAGKHVLVEKPLALDRDQLNTVARARRTTDAFFQVGFNRRFAPHALRARQHLDKFAAGKFILIRVNAGPLETDSWLNDPEHGGGRILGEACHFVDLARFLIGAEVATVRASGTGGASGGGGPCEDLSITLNFRDGSLATIAYTALGDTAVSKERIEAYAGGTVATIDDFRSLTIAAEGRVAGGRKATRQNKGHAAEIAAFVDAVAAGGPSPVDEAAMFESSLATIAAVESLQSGAAVDL